MEIQKFNLILVGRKNDLNLDIVDTNLDFAGKVNRDLKTVDDVFNQV